jgi:hypothetical protein
MHRMAMLTIARVWRCTEKGQIGVSAAWEDTYCDHGQAQRMMLGALLSGVGISLHLGPDPPQRVEREGGEAASGWRAAVLVVLSCLAFSAARVTKSACAAAWGSRRG